MIKSIIFTLALITIISGSTIINIEDFGAIASNKTAAIENAQAISAALQSAKADSIVLIPNGTEFWATGGLNATGLKNVTF